MRAFTLLIGAGVTAGIMVYRLLTAPARRRLTASKPAYSQIVASPDNLSFLYVVARRLRRHRRSLERAGIDASSPTYFEKELEHLIHWIEAGGTIGEKAHFVLRFEMNVWRSTWFELRYQAGKQPATCWTVQGIAQ